MLQSSDAGSQEMQLMSAPGGGDAREVGLARGAGQGSDDSYMQFATGEESLANLAQLRKQVLGLSGVLAAVLVLGVAAETGLDAVEMGAIVNQVKDSGAPHISKFAMLQGSAPSAFMSVLFTVAISLCGCCGAKWEFRRVVGCFSCCNALCGCCACLSMVACIGAFAIMGSMSDKVEAWVVHCDPAICMRPVQLQDPTLLFKAEDANLTCVTDCLAQNMWDDYLPRCHGAAADKYPKDCPKTFLECSREEKGAEWTRRLKGHHRRGRLPSLGQGVPWRPVDPLRACQPQLEAMEKFHRVTEVLPDLWPRLKLMVACRVIVTVVTALLMCTGARWGWDLYQELGLRCVQGSMVQPLINEELPQVAVSSPFEDGGTLERALVLRPPPSPLTV